LKATEPLVLREVCRVKQKSAASAPQLGQQWRRWLSEESCLRNWLQLSLHFTDDKLPLGAAIKTLCYAPAWRQEASRDSFFSLHCCCCFGIEMPRGCIWNALTPFSSAKRIRAEQTAAANSLIDTGKIIYPRGWAPEFK